MNDLARKPLKDLHPQLLTIAPYEDYRRHFGVDADFIEADRIRDESGCVLRYERTFMRPLLPGQVNDEP